MLVLSAVTYAIEGDVDEEYIGQGVNDLGDVVGCVVVLGVWLVGSFGRVLARTSSHQFSVEVAGLQKPLLSGGYEKVSCIIQGARL